MIGIGIGTTKWPCRGYGPGHWGSGWGSPWHSQGLRGGLGWGCHCPPAGWGSCCCCRSHWPWAPMGLGRCYRCLGCHLQAPTAPSHFGAIVGYGRLFGGGLARCNKKPQNLALLSNDKLHIWQLRFFLTFDTYSGKQQGCGAIVHATPPNGSMRDAAHAFFQPPVWATCLTIISLFHVSCSF